MYRFHHLPNANGAVENPAVVSHLVTASIGWHRAPALGNVAHQTTPVSLLVAPRRARAAPHPPRSHSGVGVRPVIRVAGIADAEAIAAIYRPAVVDSATSFELDPPDGAEMGRRVAHTLERTPWLVCEYAGAVLGYAYASAHRERAAYRWSVDVSAYVRGDVHRAGVGRGLYASLLAVLTRQGFRNAYAGITLPNEASVALHAAVGFTPVGVYRAVGYKAGAWHDVGWYARALGPHVAAPPEPTSFPALVADDPDGFTTALAVGEGHVRRGSLERVA